MAGVPHKVVFPNRKVKVGVVVQSLGHLHTVLKQKFGLSDADVSLEDGTLLCDEEYFNLLEPQTTLLVQQRPVYRRGNRFFCACSCKHIIVPLAHYSSFFRTVIIVLLNL